MNDTKKSFVQKVIDSNKELLNNTVEKTHELEQSAIETFGKVSSSAKESFNEVLDKVSTPSISVEDIFDNRVAKSLKRIGMPTANALDSIVAQLSEISSRLKTLEEQQTHTTPEEKTTETV